MSFIAVLSREGSLTYVIKLQVSKVTLTANAIIILKFTFINFFYSAFVGKEILNHFNVSITSESLNATLSR